MSFNGTYIIITFTKNKLFFCFSQTITAVDSLELKISLHCSASLGFSTCLVDSRSTRNGVNIDCKTVRIFAYSSTREQSNKRSGMRLKTESETRESV